MTDDKKSVLGTMKSDLIKLRGDPLMELIHRLIKWCCIEGDIPDGLRMERMVLLYKNAGTLSELDNYRGIFIRYILLSIIQKWLYSKCSPTVDDVGSEFAFGGRKERSVKEVLLIVRLVQDYSEWSNQPLILKFLDITKFFDTPFTPLGEAPKIEVNEVFLQGSCDAMIMAWNLVDVINKKEKDFMEPVVVIDGIKIPRVLFVDDIMELTKSFYDLRISNVGNESFERANRVDFKPVKCKAICMNCEPEESELDGVRLEVVEEHKYVGTIVAKKGRKTDMMQRIKDCKGVLNEVNEVCKTSGVSELRLRYVMMLINSCFKMKFKHGCEVWDNLTKSETETINKLVPNTLKRILEIPKATPSVAITHEMGGVDLDLEIAMERILLAVKVRKMCESRIVKQLFDKMYEKRIPGFCTSVAEALKMLEIDSLEEFDEMNDEREKLKEILVKIQNRRLSKEMLKLSKTDGLVLNYSYDGRMKEYLLKLPFREARIIFMLRTRMLPTKVNFPGRWSESKLCCYCCEIETDEHLFQCCGYSDLNEDGFQHSVFMKLDCEMGKLSDGAKTLLMIHDRLVKTNDDSMLNGSNK